MSRTYRCWHEFRSDHWIFKCYDHWKLTSMSVFGYHKAKKIRKELRKSIRCINRTNFAKKYYEPILEVWGEYFD